MDKALMEQMNDLFGELADYETCRLRRPVKRSQLDREIAVNELRRCMRGDSRDLERRLARAETTPRKQ